MKYSSYPGYATTESGVRHPIDWPPERLRFSLLSNPVKSEVSHWKDDTLVSFVPMEAVSKHGDIDLSQKKPIGDVYSGYTFFADGDVLIAKITPCFENGKRAIAQQLENRIGFGTTEFHVARPLEGINVGWLFYLTVSHAFREIGASEMLGAGGQKRVPENFIKDFRVGIPSQDEQQRIASFLDWKTGQIDALVAKKRLLISKLKEQRIAVITQAVTKGLDPNVPMRESGVEWIGQVPETWEVIPLGFLVQISGGMTPSMKTADYWEGEIPWVTPKDMKRERIKDSIDHITEFALEETSISQKKAGSILVVVRGMILAHSFPTAVAEATVTINQDMKALHCEKRLEKEYLFRCLLGFEKVLVAFTRESAHGTKKMLTDTLKKFMLPVPPCTEQLEIAKSIETRLKQLDNLAVATQATIDRLTEYRTALITAATTGKIDVRKVKTPRKKK